MRTLDARHNTIFVLLILLPPDERVCAGELIDAVRASPEGKVHPRVDFPQVRFFVEAKKPSVDIGNRDNYFQLIRYGWNSETPLAVLTDFEQFHVLDCRYQPDLETALSRAVGKYNHNDYIVRDVTMNPV